MHQVSSGERAYLVFILQFIIYSVYTQIGQLLVTLGWFTMAWKSKDTLHCCFNIFTVHVFVNNDCFSDLEKLKLSTCGLLNDKK